MILTFLLQTWLLGLFSLGMVGAAIYLAHEWQQRSWVWDETLQRSLFAPNLGWNETTALLAGGVALILLIVLGKSLVGLLLKFGGRGTAKDDDLEVSPRPSSEQTLTRPDGSILHVEFYGRAEAPPLILTHGWGLNSREWNYLKHDLAEDFRLVVWDEPGLGQSKRPDNRDYRLETLARDLEAVLDLLEGKPAVLLGHSIGGMITLTFCRLFPTALATRVRKLALVHTTPTNPVRTTSGKTVLTAIEKPILIPLMFLTIALSPLLWFMNWLSYLNGSMLITTKLTSFAGTETLAQIDYCARFQLIASPDVLARGMLAMMNYDAIPTLPEISVPTLIVTGNQDVVTNPSASEFMHARIPGAELLRLDPANHMGLIEHRKPFADAVRSFVEREII